jgi:hypothetical protein
LGYLVHGTETEMTKDLDIERKRDLSEIEFNVSCLTDSQRQQLLTMLRNPGLPDLPAIEAHIKAQQAEISRLREGLKRIKALAEKEYNDESLHVVYDIKRIAAEYLGEKKGE